MALPCLRLPSHLRVFGLEHRETMRLKERIASIFAFTAVPVTVLTLAVYAAVFISVAVLDELPPVPSNDGERLGLDLDAAYADLHKVRTG